MEYLKSFVTGNQPSVSSEQPNVAETVEKLVERVETSTLLEDRRDACRALKSLSKTYRLEVGAQAMDALVYVIQNDSSDNEIVTYALDSLNNIIGSDEENVTIATETDLSTQFTEIFIKRKENVQLILDLLPEFDFKIRWPSIKLIYSLLRNKLRESQDSILTHPMGISRLMDLLLDPREVIRNDTLLLLVYLTKNNANIQKIVAFENAFDRILEIISSEGFTDGGVVVEDCLSILLNLLKMNTSNLNFFKEGSYIQRLLPFLDISFDSTWNSQKVSNLLLMFNVIRSLISPSNPFQVTKSCQKVMNQSGVLQKLCTILLSNGIPAEILTETINCVAEVIRSNQANQDYFSRVNAPIEPPRPVIVILLMSMVNEKQPFELRCAVLYCFQSFLHKNELGQAQVVETLLPTTTEALDISAGQLLCGGFFSPDPLSNWFVAVAMSHTLVGNVTQKEQLLRVQLATDPNSPPTSLLAYCSNLLQQGGPFQRRVSILMFLATWLANSSVTVFNFLSIPTNIPLLTSQVGLVEGDSVELIIQGMCAFLLGICICYNDNSVTSFTKHDLCQLITNRIGTETFVDKLAVISKNDKYSQALKKPQLTYAKPEDVIFDFEFCNLFKMQEALILKTIQPSTSDSQNSPESNLTSEDHKLLVQYKDLIREQDQELVSLRNSLTALQNENQTLKYQLHEQQLIVQQLRDQNSLLKVQKSAYDVSYSAYPSQSVYTNSYDPNLYVATASPVPDSIQLIQPQQSTEVPTDASVVPNNFLNLQVDSSTYNIMNTDQSVYSLENQMNSMSLYQQNTEHENKEAELNSYTYSGGEQKPQENLEAGSSQLEYLINENRRLQSIIDQYKYYEQQYYATQPIENLSTNVNFSDSDISSMTKDPEQQYVPSGEQPKQQCEQSDKDASRLKLELETLRKEQDDLLALMADQDLKMQKYANKLKELGHEINDDETEQINYLPPTQAALQQPSGDTNSLPEVEAAPEQNYYSMNASQQQQQYLSVENSNV